MRVHVHKSEESAVCMCARVRACVRVCARACVRVCAGVCVSLYIYVYTCMVYGVSCMVRSVWCTVPVDSDASPAHEECELVGEREANTCTLTKQKLKQAKIDQLSIN